MGPQPHPGVESPNPAQAGLATLAKHEPGIGRSVVVLVGCSGCRSRREASGPNANAIGSSHPASCSGGERASEARPRWQSRGRGGGLAGIPYSRRSAQAGLRGTEAKASAGEAGRAAQAERTDEPERRSEHSSREGVLVSTMSPSLTRRRRRRGLAASPGGLDREVGSRSEGPRQRTSEATLRARRAEENAAAGRRSAEELSIEAPPGPRSARSRRCSGSPPDTSRETPWLR